VKKDLKHLTHRSFLPVAIAGAFAVALIVVLVVVMWKPAAVGPSAEELAADTAKGLQYERGEGVTMDYGQALSWYRKAAEAGYPPAEYALGIMTMAGRGLVKDPKAAVEWYRRAAEQGFAEAQVQLASELVIGTGTADGKPDRVEALKWLLLGAEGMPDPLTKQVALKTRDTLAFSMSVEDRAEAERRVIDWRKQHQPQ
jgi:TPR repeat protein